MTPGTRTITLKGGPRDGETLDVPDTAVSVPYMGADTSTSKYEEANPDEPPLAVMHCYSARDGTYLGWEYV